LNSYAGLGDRRAQASGSWERVVKAIENCLTVFLKIYRTRSYHAVQWPKFSCDSICKNGFCNPFWPFGELSFAWFNDCFSKDEISPLQDPICVIALLSDL